MPARSTLTFKARLILSHGFERYGLCVRETQGTWPTTETRAQTTPRVTFIVFGGVVQQMATAYRYAPNKERIVSQTPFSARLKNIFVLRCGYKHATVDWETSKAICFLPELIQRVPYESTNTNTTTTNNSAGPHMQCHLQVRK